MFYNELKAIMACEEDPSLIFELIKEGHMDVVDKVLFKKKVDLNVVDEDGNSVLMRLLKAKSYTLVLKYMKKEQWDINHQNHDGKADVDDQQEIQQLDRKGNDQKQYDDHNEQGYDIIEYSIHSPATSCRSRYAGSFRRPPSTGAEKDLLQ